MIRFIVGVVIGIVCLIFFIQNGEIVSVTFLAWTATLPRYLLFALFLLAGVFLGWLVRSVRNFGKKKK